MTDEKLVELCKQGEEYAFELLVRRYHQHLHNFIFNYIQERQTTEDIVQETFIKMIKNIANYKNKDNAKFSTWLFTIARNTVTDEIRKGKIRKTVPIDDEEIMLSDTGESVEDEIIRNETLDKVTDTIDTLPTDQKSIILLRYYMDLNYNEISTILSSTPEKVKGRLHYALEILRKKLGMKGVNFDEQ